VVKNIGAGGGDWQQIIRRVRHQRRDARLVWAKIPVVAYGALVVAAWRNKSVSIIRAVLAYWNELMVWRAWVLASSRKIIETGGEGLVRWAIRRDGRHL